MCKHLIWIGMDHGYRCEYYIVSVKRCGIDFCNYFDKE